MDNQEMTPAEIKAWADADKNIAPVPQPFIDNLQSFFDQEKESREKPSFKISTPGNFKPETVVFNNPVPVLQMHNRNMFLNHANLFWNGVSLAGMSIDKRGKEYVNGSLFHFAPGYRIKKGTNGQPDEIEILEISLCPGPGPDLTDRNLHK